LIDANEFNLRKPIGCLADLKLNVLKCDMVGSMTWRRAENSEHNHERDQTTAQAPAILSDHDGRGH
jgi:hypothetical protein